MVRVYSIAGLLLVVAGAFAQILLPDRTLDLFYHDKYMVIAPSHVPVAGAMLMIVAAGIAALFTSLTGCELSSRLGYTHLVTTAVCVAVLYLAAVLMATKTVGPHDPGELIFPGIASYAALIALVLVQFVFLANLLWSWLRKR